MEQTFLVGLLTVAMSIGIIRADAIEAELTRGGQFIKAPAVNVES